MISVLRELVPEPTAEHARVASILSVANVDRWVASPRRGPGRPAWDRKVLVRAFLAKFVLQCPSTERLRHRLMADEGLRAALGMVGEVPSAATFSRAFREFAYLRVGESAHEALVVQEYSELEVWHVARDATAISSWERPVRAPKPPPAPKLKIGRPKGGNPAKPKVETRMQRQLVQSAERAITELPTQCTTGTKLDSNGFPHWWMGYKLHADVDEHGFPLSVILTSANVHDCQVAIPLMKTTSARTKSVFYQLMDAGYLGKLILEAAMNLDQVPIVAPKARAGTPVIPLSPDRKERMKKRCAVERFFAQLKNNSALGASRYRGYLKVNLQVMLAILALCATMMLNKTGQI